MQISQWAQDRLGGAAPGLQEAVQAAIPEAHRDAVAAQAASRTRKRDPYGHTMKNRQHECLVAAAREVPGVQVFRPRGASFELVQVPATRAVLFPWRYATDNSTSRQEARMRPSGLRRELLSSATQASGQMVIEHAALDDEELEAQLAEDDAIREQLRSMARVITVGYASNVSGLLALGWGEAELVDDSGTVYWQCWELLTPRNDAGVKSDRDGPTVVSGAAGLGAAPGEAPRPAETAARSFHDLPLDDDLGLRARSPLAGEREPEVEADPAPRNTGTEDEQP